jgi:hypothetical protein
MKLINSLLFTFVLMFSSFSFALEFKPEASTTAPLFLGAGVDITFTESWGVDLQVGFAPQPYVDAIGSYVSSSAGNSSYDNVIDAGFKNNQMWKLGTYYRFQTGERWKANLNVYGVTSSGKAGIDDVLAAATGKDYTAFKNFLIARGKRTEVDMDSDLMIAEISASYTWLFSQWSVEGIFGFAKITSATVDLSTGYPNLDTSNLMSTSESDMEEIMIDNGFTPVLGVLATYRF